MKKIPNLKKKSDRRGGLGTCTHACTHEALEPARTIQNNLTFSLTSKAGLSLDSHCWEARLVLGIDSPRHLLFTRSSSCALRADSTRETPSLDNWKASSSPMPLDAPVTHTTMSVSSHSVEEGGQLQGRWYAMNGTHLPKRSKT